MPFIRLPPTLLLIAVSMTTLLPAAQTRILCLGDSITQSDNLHKSYRYNLWTKLIDAGTEFDFIGSVSSNNGGSPTWPDYLGKAFDRDHEGHWGWRADEIRASLPGWLANYTPDIALIHLGSNDLIQFQSVASTVEEISATVSNIEA